MGTARASAAPCPIQLTGVESAAWRAAAEELARVDFRESDCAEIVVDVAPAGARVSFTTEDGREAVRTLSDPAELRPTVEALLVGDSLTPPAAPPPARPPPQKKPKPKPARSSSPVKSTAAEPPSPEAARSGSAYALQTGVRFGSQIGGGDADAILLSPVLVGSAWMGRYPWELGIIGAFEFQYFDLRDHDPGQRENSSVSVGVAVGRRDTEGALDVMTSLRLSVATIESENEEGSGEARGGVAVGLSYPNYSTVRFRADLCAELVAGSNVTSPESPEWAVSTLLGVEIGGG